MRILPILYNFTSIFEDKELSITLENALLVILTALALGCLTGIAYVFTHRKTGIAANIPMTIIIMPLVVATVIMLVSNSFASAFALAGVFTLVRFRSEPGEPSDLCYIFASVAIGLCCGMGVLLYACIICAVLIAVLMIIHFTNFGQNSKHTLQLRIVIPEDLNYQNLFDDIFEKYQVKAYLQKVKTIDLGSAFELSYLLNAKNDFDQKAFIDELRVRNGNLNIYLTLAKYIQ